MLGAPLVCLLALLLTAFQGPRTFLDITAGPLCLVSLTATVAWGLLAADRLLLTPRRRLLAQALHRAMATSALGFLLLHATVKIGEGHARPRDAFLPAPAGDLPTGAASAAPLLVALGSLAAYLLVLAATTGVLRGLFAGRGRIAGRWRALHACAYPAWCLALVHGLKSGRSPSGWVTAGYALCLAAVVCALLLRRLLPAPPAPRPPTLPDRGIPRSSHSSHSPHSPHAARRRPQ